MDGMPFGRYRLVELLGRGGMGEVWRAHDTAIDRMVALKRLLPHYAQDRTFTQRFRREARVAARLDDPHVVPIYDVGVEDGHLYVTMRLITGHDLQTLLKGGPLEPERAVRIIEQVADALHAAHQVGLVHRDIKPSNILLADNDFVYLIDFGIARAAEDTLLTSTGATVGTWAYMAPERFNTGQVDTSGDIYALGCVLYQCLTGQLPFPGTTMEQMAMAHMVTPAPKPSTKRHGIPKAMDDVIATGLAKDPNLRYPTAQKLAASAKAAVTEPMSIRTADTVRAGGDPSIVDQSALPPTASGKPPTGPLMQQSLSTPGNNFASAVPQHRDRKDALTTPSPTQRSERVQTPGLVKVGRSSKRRVISTILIGLAVILVAIGIGAIISSVHSLPNLFSGLRTVSKSDVESQISQKMTDAAGNKPDSVSCPGALNATVGAQLNCSMKIKDKTYGVNVTVTSVEGDTAKFDMVETLDKNDVASEISDQETQRLGHKPDSVTCSDNLKGVVGATLKCQLVDQGQTTPLTVTVTSVEGGVVNFNIAPDNQPAPSTSPSP